MENKIVKIIDQKPVIPQEVCEIMRDLNREYVRFNDIMTTAKEEMTKLMREYGVKSFENEIMRITYKAPSVRNKIDEDALKEQGLYEHFLKQVPVKDGVVIKFK